jgi:hypothetical protein
VKIPLCILAILSPVLGWAQLAGDWAGVTTDSQGAHRVALHISGPFTAMRGTVNIADQKLNNAPVESITFLESTLQFSIPASDVQYSGVLNDNGNIVGTLTEHGAAAPLVLARMVSARTSVPVIRTDGGEVEDGRYHDTLTGVEFDLPADWYLLRTDPDVANPGGVRVFADRSRKALVVTVNMMKANLTAENVPKVLQAAIPHQIAMRTGQTEAGPMHQVANYKIRDGSVQQITVGGQQAVRAIGDFDEGGKSIAEVLVWVCSEHTRVYFMVRGAAENLADLQASFDQMLQSAKIP